MDGGCWPCSVLSSHQLVPLFSLCSVALLMLLPVVGCGAALAKPMPANVRLPFRGPWRHAGLLCVSGLVLSCLVLQLGTQREWSSLW